MPAEGIADGQPALTHRRFPPGAVRRQIDLGEHQLDHPVEDVVLVGDMVVERHRLDPEPWARRRMVSEPRPSASASATAADSARSRVSGVRAVLVLPLPAMVDNLTPYG
jgi:hypothetical protein